MTTESKASNTQSISISVMGKDYRVACPAGEQSSLQRAADFLDTRMREIRDAGVNGNERIAVMAALNLSHEFLDATDNVGEESADQGQINELIDRLDLEINHYKAN